MRYLTQTECQAWTAEHGISIRPDGVPERYPSAGPVVRFELPKEPMQLHWLCRFVSECLEPRYTCLLWVKEFGKSPMTDNLHLYYRLRQSYGDLRLLEDAPGHLFLPYEEADFVTFLQVGIINAWEMHLFPELAYGDPDTARAIIAHDNEWIALYHREMSTMDEWRSRLARTQCTLLTDRSGSE